MIERGAVRVHVDALPHQEHQRAKIVDAVGLVGMRMCHQHTVEMGDARGEQLLAKIG